MHEDASSLRIRNSSPPTQRGGADLSSTVPPGSISNPFGGGLHLCRAVAQRHRLHSNLSAVPGLVCALIAEQSLVCFSLPTTIPVQFNSQDRIGNSPYAT